MSAPNPSVVAAVRNARIARETQRREAEIRHAENLARIARASDPNRNTRQD